MKPGVFYKRIPVLAIQYRGDNADDVIAFARMHNIGISHQPLGNFRIHTRTGTNLLRKNDWLVRNGPDDGYPIEGTIFKKSYISKSAFTHRLNCMVRKKSIRKKQRRRSGRQLCTA